ncbi:MAG: hypothetical protein H6509_08185 [Bryobacterales bacterium]|nr:hypothetical protein [Bryobacterales bacterium]
MSKELENLIEATRNWKLTPSEQEAQRRSFAYGNAKIENPRITRAMIDRQAEALERRKK